MHEKISEFKSTQVMITGNFEAYHYREPYFKSLDFHTHDFYEAYLFLDGSVTYYIEEHAYDLCAGDLLLIPPGKMHRPVISNSTAVYERMVLWLNTSYLRTLDIDGSLFQALHTFGGDRGYLVNLSGEDLAFTVQLLNRLIRAEKAGVPGGDLCCQSLIITFLYAVCAAFGEQTHPTATASRELIPEVIRYINEHFTEPICLDEICGQFFISKFYLTRKFKEYTNATLYDYILSKRIGLARRLIRQGVTAAIVSEQCGFSDYSNFYKAFTAKTGMPPARFKSLKNG